MLLLDAWYDYWRLGLILISTVCMVLLGIQFARNRKRWDERQHDRWFMLIMWNLATWEMQLEALLRDTPLRYRLVFITAASLLTLKLLTKPYDRPANS